MTIHAVIVPLDFSPGALRAVLPAGAIARRFGARVLPVTSRFGWDDKDPASELAALTQTIGAVTDPPRVYDRFAPNAISELAHTTRDSIVCMATQGREGLARLTGSVAEDVLCRVRAPVVLIGPSSIADPTADTGPVLICVDGSSVANAIVPIVIEWLRGTCQVAQFVRVARPDEDEDADAAGVPLSGIAVGLPADIAERVSWTVLQHDEAAPAIVEFARREQAPLIAMATHGRTGLRRIVVGSVTTRVVHDASCPILTVRPAALHD